MGIVDVMLVVWVVFVIATIGLLAAYPYEILLMFRGASYMESTYPKPLEQAGVEYYLDNGSTHVILNETEVVRLRPLCTGSMVPTLGCDSIVFGVPIGYEVGASEIVVYEKDGDMVMHRVVGYDSTERCWMFRGDNNKMPDFDCVKQDKLRYKVVMIVYTGG